MDPHLFISAARKGDLKTVLQFLDQEKIDPDIATERVVFGEDEVVHEETALEAAVGALHPDIVKVLLEHGANPNLENENGETPIGIAVSLLNENEEEPLSPLEKKNLYSIVDELLKRGADPNYVNENGQFHTLLTFALADDEIFDLLIRNGADPTIPDNRGFQALHYAIVHNDLKKIKTLIEAGAGPVKFTDADLATIIYLENNRIVRGQELEQWVKPETWALANSAIPVEDVDPTIVDQDGNSNLLYAVAFNYPFRVDKYLETLTKMDQAAGLKDQMKLWNFIHNRNRDGNTPLHYAVVAQNPVIVYLLAQFGFNPKQANNEGLTPEDFAKEQNDPTILDILSHQFYNQVD